MMMASLPNPVPRTRILIIDDDLKLCRLIRDYLEPMGYEVEAAHDGNTGLQQALSGRFAAVILDVMLPGKDGVEVLRRLRVESNVPVLMLTGRGEEPDRIVGLELGADDYLPKTFSIRELLARLRAVIRRASAAAIKPSSNVPEVIVVGNLQIDPASRSARLAGEILQLTAVEFDLLMTLASSAGRIQSREQLLLQIADRDFDVFDRSIDVHISSLRKKLGDDPKMPRFIVTVRSAGYMMRKAGSQVES
jgi:two-component system response regulator CpxR